jgi:hypothetical protein
MLNCRSLPQWLFAMLVASASMSLHAGNRMAGPDDYRQAVRDLREGDTLLLRPGVYTGGLDIHRLTGQPGARIVIRGAPGSRRSIFVARPSRNTVSIVDAAYVTLADIDLVGAAGVDVDAVKAEGTARFAHDITIERVVIRGYSASQQNVAISTKCAAWNWVIRGNVILGGGTGFYLGNSDGSAPFVNGLIERNIVAGTTGYALQIKHQHERIAVEGMPQTSATTILRFNAFVKDRNSSAGTLARPNVLLGHWPPAGAGSGDRYIVYGNIFLDNPHEALLQAEGNLAIYNNLFVNRMGRGVTIHAHKGTPRNVDVFRNTIVTQGTGLSLRDGDTHFVQRATSNAIFSPGVSPDSLADDNLSRALGRESEYLFNPDAALEALDLAPFPRVLADPSFSLDGRGDLPDVQLDFDRTRRIAAVAGAYAGSARAERARLRELAAILNRMNPQAKAGG